MESTTWTEVTSAEELRELLGSPSQRVAEKVRPELTELDRQWLAVSPLCVVATSDAQGRVDASPKGDPAGHLVHVLDDHTVALAERPGNRRADGFLNVLENPHVGLLFLVPGRGDTLRVNGRARLVREAPFFDDMAVKGKRPVLALVVEVEEVFFHCAKAFLRSGLWQPETWPAADTLPSRARIAKALERPDTPLEELERYYGPDYARDENLYGA
ncbi:pyridoxamine 5'-phosphate oxidase family protein [Oryzihumus sp.]|uniref:pyridoxamine 5'-phosphate oxidase family protein n=1 Tax=Oryzihumus sp. TaxID=1968903 RepID=UPI002ED7C9B9